MLKTRSLQTRILALFLVLLVGVQLGGFVLINTVGVAAARKSTGDDLLAGTQLFSHLLDQERERLMQGARLLAGDFAFRDAIASRDRARLGAALAEHGRRVDAGLVMLIGLGSARHWGYGGRRRGRIVHVPAPARRSAAIRPGVGDGGRARTALSARDRAGACRAQQADLVAGRRLSGERRVAREMRKLMRPDLSFLSRFDGGSWILQGSTLDGDARATLLAAADTRGLSTTDELGNTTLDDGAVAARAIDLPAHTDDAVIAVLQQPVASALEPFRRLQAQLAFVSAIAVALSVAVALVVARGIARPVRELSAAAQKIAAGDYFDASAGCDTNTRDRRSRLRFPHDAGEDRFTRVAHSQGFAYRDGLKRCRTARSTSSG